MIRFATGLALIAALATLSACGTTSESGGSGAMSSGEAPETNEDAGTASAIIKSKRGGLVGGSVGTGLSDDEKTRALEAEYRALEYSQAGQPVTWKGDEQTTYGEAKAAQPYRVGSQDCRQYRQTVDWGGRSRVARGTACRNPDGSWTPLT